MLGRLLRRGLLAAWMLQVGGCGGSPGQKGSGAGDGDETSEDGDGTSNGGDSKAPGEGIDFTFGSLDVPALPEQSENWCVPPAFEPAGFSGLDQATLAEVFADYVTGWMTPLHESLLGLNEVDLWDSVFEMIFASYQTDCDWNEDADLEAFPPPDGELLDPTEQMQVRDDVRQAILNAEVLSEGDAVRLVLRECESCAEGLASHPLFLTARMTNDGVLVAEVDLGHGQAWSRTLYVTPDAAVVQASLAQYSTWSADVTAATPDTDAIAPHIEGTVTAVIRKDNAGGISATVGVSDLSFDAQPGQAETVRGRVLDDCVGFHFGLSGGSGEAQWAWELGNFELTVPGAVNCAVPECGTAEREQDWVYTLGGVSATAEQPGPVEPENLRLQVVAQSASRARVGQNEFARGGIGKLGEGGRLGLSVDKTAEGFWVTFNPALELGGAMTITAFSEQLRMNLPDWLQNEIFDVTFGGDPRAQVFVPAREPCAEYPEYDPTPPPRRSVQVVSGELRATRNNGDLFAGPGTCVGVTLAAQETLTLTSDWIEAGYACE